MPDYSKSIIYTIRSRDSVYVGSTIDFRSRKYQHKCYIYNEKNKNYNVKLYKTIRENDGEWDIQPYSKYPCKDILELTIEEERIRQLLKADMNTNSCGTGLTKNEYKKQYNDINKVKIKKVKKQYYQKNKDKLNENMKQYREQHKDEIKKYFQNMSVEKKNQRNEKKIEKVICECGCVVSSRNMSRHRKSKKHLKLIQSLEV